LHFGRLAPPETAAAIIEFISQAREAGGSAQADTRRADFS